VNSDGFGRSIAKQSIRQEMKTSEKNLVCVQQSSCNYW